MHESFLYFCAALLWFGGKRGSERSHKTTMSHPAIQRLKSLRQQLPHTASLTYIAGRHEAGWSRAPNHPNYLHVHWQDKHFFVNVQTYSSYVYLHLRLCCIASLHAFSLILSISPSALPKTRKNSPQSRWAAGLLSGCQAGRCCRAPELAGPRLLSGVPSRWCHTGSPSWPLGSLTLPLWPGQMHMEVVVYTHNKIQTIVSFQNIAGLNNIPHLLAQLLPF